MIKDSFIAVVTLLLCIACFVGMSYAIELPLTAEPPLQVTGVEVADGSTQITWHDNSETDLAGYIVFLSVNPAANEFEYNGAVQIDNGLDTYFDFSNPEMLPFWLGGYQVYFGIAAYDTSNNVSGITTTTDAGSPVGITFFADAPPAEPDGLSKN